MADSLRRQRPQAPPTWPAHVSNLHDRSCSFYLMRSSLGQTTNDPEEERNEEDPDCGGEEHSSEDTRSDGVTTRRTSAGREHERQHAENECERRHEDRSQS